MVSGGHALNAPQRATANINCRIFPGHSPAAIMAELEKVAGEPTVTFKDVTEGSVPNDASPLDGTRQGDRERSTRSIPACRFSRRLPAGPAIRCWFRHLKVPSYGVAPTFIRTAGLQTTG